MRTRSTTALLAIIPAAALVLAGCATTPAASSESGKVDVVASTNVYGDIASKIGGSDVSVTSLISSSAQDPHSFEASAQDQLAVKKADVVIENGGGYDPFIDTLVSAAGNDKTKVINVVDLSGLAGDDHADHDHADADHTDAPADSTESADDGHGHIEGFNEHVFYDLPTMAKLADELAKEFGAADSANADTFTKNAETFKASLTTIENAAAAIKTDHDGAGVAITEPVPLYLLQSAGLVNKTPAEFSEAIEEGTDVSPAVLKETLDLFGTGTVSLLAYNEQTSGAETEQVEKAATAAGVPVVSFTETLPDGKDYLSWMTSNVEAVAKALQK
ncbi:metal ABC transporter solute-binding protein, Zn/Mn family [Plantibacter sp. YIM 135347]|uniref:metal ABC transporter solute-binding protein, Zn/Mn family n=1 Tax=Plantibacter sp. YIM 135347 TaxID=3423919 RepID=UPI003D3419BD